MAGRITPSRWLWTSALLCAAAAGALAWQFGSDAEVAPPPPAPPPPAAAADMPREVVVAPRPEAAFSIPPAEDFAETQERPLFVRDRRPLSAEARAGEGAEGGEQAPASQITLAGVIVAGERRLALLRFDSEAKVTHVAEGQEAAGWLIESIAADRVVLRRGEAARVVALDYRREAAAAAPGVALQPPGRQAGARQPLPRQPLPRQPPPRQPASRQPPAKAQPAPPQPALGEAEPPE